MLGICVGMQVLFELGVEWGERTEGCGQWPGIGGAAEGRRAAAHGLEHGRAPPGGSALFAGLDADTRFYFVHSFAVRRWELEPSAGDPPAAGHLGPPR